MNDSDLDLIKNLYSTGSAEDRIKARNKINELTDLRPSCPSCYSGHLDLIGTSQKMFGKRYTYRCDKCGFIVEK